MSAKPTKRSTRLAPCGAFAAAGLLLALTQCTRPPAGEGAASSDDAAASQPQARAPLQGQREPQQGQHEPLQGQHEPQRPATADRGAPPPADALPRLRGRGEVRVGDAPTPVLRVEVARTAAERAQGLMYRRHLADDAGMVFDMERSGDWSFWMKNTLIPLDMIFIDARWRVVCVVANAEPETLQSRGCGQPSRWVLELSGGGAARHGIAAGTPLRFRPLADGAAAAEATP